MDKFLSLFLLLVFSFSIGAFTKMENKSYTSEGHFYNNLFISHFNKGKGSNCILMLHGYPASRQKNYDLAEILALKGYEVILPHYEGLGFSNGNFGFKKSLDGIIELITSIKSTNPNCSLSILGHSWGGFLAVQLSKFITGKLYLLAPLTFIPLNETENLEIPYKDYSSIDNFVNFLLSISPEDSSQYTLETLKEEIKELSTNFSNNIEIISQRHIPIKIFHAIDDQVIPITFSKALTNDLKKTNNISLYEIENNDHTFDLKRTNFIKNISNWISYD